MTQSVKEIDIMELTKDKLIHARLATSDRYYYGDICFLKSHVAYFRQGHDCNHTIVGANEKEYEIYMKFTDFKKIME